MPSSSIKSVGAQDLHTWLSGQKSDSVKPVILDVRELWEIETCALPDSLHIPMAEVPARFKEMDPDAPTVCLCHHGVRSLQVAYFLVNQGFKDVYNMRGGINAWSLEVDNTVPTY